MRSLVISQLDLDREPNQRTQHMVRMLAEHSDEVVVLFSARNTGRGWRRLLDDALRWRAEVTREGRVLRIRVNPWLNYAQALAHGLAADHGAGPDSDAQAGNSGDITDPNHRTDGVHRRGSARRLLADALSSLGALRDLAWLPSMQRALRHHAGGGFDLTLADGPWPAQLGLALRRAGRAGALVYDDMDHVAGGQRVAWRRRWIERLEAQAVRGADLAVCVGDALAALRQRQTGRQLPVLPNAADATRFAPPAQRPAHPPTVLYMGRLEATRGVDLALQAMALVHRQRPAARLLVVGDGDAAFVAQLNRQRQALGLTEVVELTGAVPHDALPAYVHRSDIGLATFSHSPQGRYAVPLKVAEYMAGGLPVVCTRGSAAADWVLRCGAGRAVDFHPQALAAAIVELLDDPLQRRAASAAGLAAAAPQDWPTLCAQLWRLAAPLPAVAQAQARR